jgi:hypothetical protein
MRWILIVILFVSAAQADVTRKHHSTSQFMGSNEATSTEYYTSDKQASEAATKWTSGMMKTMTGGKEALSTSIIRLDKELVWNVDPKDKSYTEMTFAEFREMMKKGLAQMDEAKEKEKEAGVADSVAEDMYEWKVVDKSAAEPKTIRGWNCRNVHVEATGTNKKDANDFVILELDAWNSPDIPGAAEIVQFHERYLKALGMDFKALTPGLTQAGLLYQKQLNALVESAKNAPGEPVQSLLEIKRNQLKTPNLGKAIGEGAANELMGKLPFGKKKPPKEEKPEYELKVKFHSSTELLEAAATTVDVSKFEVPAGFKLKKK